MSTARHHRSNRGLFDQHSLALEEPRAEPQAVTAPVLKRLWFCIYLPKLSLEASGPGGEARAVVVEQQGIHRVLLASTKAEAAGIMPGQSANAALALLPMLHVEPRSEIAEQQALENLSCWLEQFTSVVCFADTDVLLVEIAGSLRLYGGLLSLRQQIAAGLEQQGFSALLAIAPTPLAATWLAKSGRRACIRDTANIATALRTVPLTCLDWPNAVCESLSGMGIRNIGDCLRLPREGFARRFGPRRLIELDRALGRLPDPRTSWRAPERFCADYEMTEEQSDRELLLAICRELLLSLERFLLTRQLGVQRLLFSFFHLRGPATQLQLGCTEPERLADRWFDLLRIRFEKLTLPEPVISVRLRGGHSQAVRAETRRLRFQGKAAGQGLRFSMTQLAERLIARVGNQSVAGVTTVAEHRPQLAWRSQGLLSGKKGNTVSAMRMGLRRPLWILPEPVLLPVDQGYPLHQGRLRILEGPERLETGWWDEDGIARDYYTAVNPRGMHMWVFRNRSHNASWYLHGFFG
ncbi:MAG: DNA polymerase Y family protein [Gammaproteobacteria bacterium]|nr:DNA polymerase Y family protein [Gammaproteobacteria bacterium]MDH3408447.1 DNA polymerase Y family protein [Gammaproteobacteria bacterium]MDH3551207.1 DNA polymerase Y family protein [Gammaproteobacteria bacterium]